MQDCGARETASSSRHHSTPLATRALVGLAVCFGLLATTYNVLTPVLEAPDEEGHVLYVYHLKQTGRLPDLMPGTYQAQNESWQPPLYYVIGSLLTCSIDMQDLDEFTQWANPHRDGGTGGVNAFLHRQEVEGFPYRGVTLAIHLLRALSTAFGIVTVIAVFGIACEVFPNRPYMALAASAVAALNPQFLFISGAVNNDSSVTAMCALTLWGLARAWRRGMSWKRALALGALSGLATLCKLSALALLPTFGLALIVQCAIRR
jgi:4-amino-4-deoxy-L-arabinose transferase-like glycosyltransferase